MLLTLIVEFAQILTKVQLTLCGMRYFHARKSRGTSAVEDIFKNKRFCFSNRFEFYTNGSLMPASTVGGFYSHKKALSYFNELSYFL